MSSEKHREVKCKRRLRGIFVFSKVFSYQFGVVAFQPWDYLASLISKSLQNGANDRRRKMLFDAFHFVMAAET